MVRTATVFVFFVLGTAQFCPKLSSEGDKACEKVIRGSRCQINHLDENQKEAQKQIPSNMGICSASGVNGAEVMFVGCTCDDSAIFFATMYLRDLPGPSLLALPARAGFCPFSSIGDKQCNEQVTGSRCRIAQLDANELPVQRKLLTAGVCSLATLDGLEARFFGCGCTPTKLPLPSVRVSVSQLKPVRYFTALTAAIIEPRFCPNSLKGDDPCDKLVSGSRCQIDHFDANQVYVRNEELSIKGLCSANILGLANTLFLSCNCRDNNVGYWRVKTTELPSPAAISTTGSFCPKALEGDGYCDKRIGGSRCQINGLDATQRLARDTISSMGVCSKDLVYKTEHKIFGCNCDGSDASIFTIFENSTATDGLLRI